MIPSTFFGEAGNAANIETGRPALDLGDVVMDNCPTHDFAGGEALQEWLGYRNIEHVYMPTNYPDFNPVIASTSVSGVLYAN